MFRCKECQTEYKIKPDYCDCGNDTFDEIVETPPKTEEQKPLPQPVLTPKEKTTRKAERKSQVDAFGWIIFSFCVILSFIIVFFIGNPKDEPIHETKEEVKVDTSYIPRSTDAFWDNTVKEPEPETVKEEVQKVIEQIIPKAVQPKPVQNVQKPAQTTQKPAQKTITQTKPAATTPAKTTNTQQQKTNVQLPKSITDIANQHKTTQTQQTPTTQQTSKPAQTTVQQQPKAEPKKMNQQDYANYKINLRNTIAQKINFAGVIGDGDCVVSFSVSNNGTLINRKFEKQSANNTLNDAVYHAIMQTPGFKNPPEGYNGQTMRFTVKMYGGNFEVTLN